MRVNTNINLRNRSRIELKNFKGLDTLSSPVEVSSIHGMECENLISRDGVNHKRYGWKTKLRIGNGKINAIFSFKLGDISYVIVYTGGDNSDNTGYTHAFYSVTSDSASRISKVSDASGWTDDCKCFVNGDKAYFIGFGDFLVYDGNKLKKVIDDSPYIPTTTENIGSEEKGQHYTRITAEERNLLSPYVYNTLYGEVLGTEEIASYMLSEHKFESVEVEVNDNITLLPTEDTSTRLTQGMEIPEDAILDLSNTTIELVGTGFSGGNVKSLVLPTMTDLIAFENNWSIKAIFKQAIGEGVDNVGGVEYHRPTKVEALLKVYDNEGTERGLALGSGGYSEISYKFFTIETAGVVKTTWYLTFDWDYITILGDSYLSSLKNQKISNIYYGKYYSPKSNEKMLKSADEKYTGQYNQELGIVRLHGYKDDVSAFAPKTAGKPNIKVKIKLSTDKTTEVTKATNGIKFGLGGSDDRLFLTNDNVVMWSKDEDFTYFGEKSWCLCGTKETKIKDLDRLNDSTLLLVKEYSVREPSVYVISGVLNQGVTEGGTIDYTAVFTPKGYQVGMGAVGELTNFNGDCLMVCKDGVYSVSLGENMTVDARYIHHRSRQITNELSKYDLSKAKTISFDGKYYLAIDGKCYVADNKYLASFKGDMQNALNYEWWKWTNMPVNCWGYVDNELCFGTLDSEICVFTDKFYDERQSAKNIGSGQMGYKTEGNDYDIVGFTFTGSGTVTVSEIITLVSDFYGKVETNKFDVIDGKTRFYVPLNDIHGTTIYFDKYGNGGGKEITKEETYFEVDYVPEITKNNTVIYYQNFRGVTLGLTKKSNYYALVYNGKELIGAPATGINPSQVNAVIRLPIRMPITAKWITGALDLGTRSHAKTLTKLIMTGEKDLANHLKYGIKTRVTNRNYEFLRANNDLDFENLDLETLSLDSQFASSFVKRLNLRNVNFIQLYLMSDTEEDMAINSIEVEYKIIKNNIGVN